MPGPIREQKEIEITTETYNLSPLLFDLELEDPSVDDVEKEGNRMATLIAHSVISDQRLQSYVATCGSSWLHHLLAQESAMFPTITCLLCCPLYCKECWLYYHLLVVVTFWILLMWFVALNLLHWFVNIWGHVLTGVFTPTLEW